MRRIAVLCVAFAAAGPLSAGGPLDYRDDLSPKDRARVAAVTAPPEDFSKPQRFEKMMGGAATSTATPNINAFSQFSANLTFKGEESFKLGNGLFNKLWVSAPSSTLASDGLGPLYNARSCERCHLKDGRGHPPSGPDDAATSMFLRLSVPARTEAEKKALADRTLTSIPDPTYGGQLQDFAVPGLEGEGRMAITYEEKPVDLNGGGTASLRVPTYAIADPKFGPPDPDIMISPRIAPPMTGMGLLQAIHPGDILANADPDDADGDGISGRVNMVRDPQTAAIVPGRFGWKASVPNVRAQTAGAFSGDIGISTPDMPDAHGDCTANETACRALPTGVQVHLGDTEAPDPVLDLVTFYAENLAPPARRDVDDPQVLEGKALFYAVGCANCHHASYVTSRKATQKEHRFQLIWPYTDLLVHDMGEGLADHRPVGDASGSEWRTAPLWGIGLTQTVSGHTYFLHDGRARNLLEAVLWHGGEAEAAREAVVAMTPDDRAALIRFLESL